MFTFPICHFSAAEVVYDNTVMKFTIDTSKGSGGTANRFYLPIIDSVYVNPIYVDWGDGSAIEAIDSGTYPYHQYSSAGVYQIIIDSNGTGKTPQLKFNLTSSSMYNTSRNMLISIDTPLLTYYSDASTEVTSFNSLFSGCLNLTSIPKDLFKYNTKVTTCSSLFNGCTSLKKIPSGIFNSLVNCTDFYSCFSSCTSITSIPTNLFRYNTKVTTFGQCFYKCTFTSIPEDLFKYNTKVTTLSSIFHSCTSLTSIPADLFKYNTEVTTFSNAFCACSSLESIPTDLFRYNTKVTDFTSTFSGCTSLTSIPADLFKYNTLLSYANSTFYDCSSLTSVPTDLFRYNTSLLRVLNIFMNCTSLKSIPTNLFYYNPSINWFAYAFKGCTSLTTTINPTLGNFFSSNMESSGLRVQQMFYNCSVSMGNATDFVNTFADRTDSDTYRKGALYNCTSWTGYSSIAAIWKTA